MLYAGKLRPAGGYQIRYKWGGLWDGFSVVGDISTGKRSSGGQKDTGYEVKNRSL